MPTAIDFLNAPDTAPKAVDYLNAPDEPKPNATDYLNSPDQPASTNNSVDPMFGKSEEEIQGAITEETQAPRPGVVEELFTPVAKPLSTIAEKIPAEVYGGAGIPGLEALNAVVGTGDYIKGFAESAAGGAESMFMSPGGAALALTGSQIPKAAHGIIGLLFGAQGIRQFPEQWKALQSETDPAKRQQLYGKLVGDTAMIALGAKGAKDVWTELKPGIRTVPDEHLAAAVAESPGHPIGKLAATELQARGLEQSGAPATAEAVREVAPVINEVLPTGELQSTVGLPPKAVPLPITGARAESFDANHPIAEGAAVDEAHAEAAAKHFEQTPIIELNEGDQQGVAMIVRNAKFGEKGEKPFVLAENPLTAEYVTGKDGQSHSPEIGADNVHDLVREAQRRGLSVDESALSELRSIRDTGTTLGEPQATGREGQTQPQVKEPVAAAPTAEAITDAGKTGEAVVAHPSDYTPALREPSGNVITGQKGETHADIKARQPQQWRDANTLAEADNQAAEHGFVDAQGNFQTREQVASALGEKVPMQSEKLSKLQAEAKAREAREQPKLASDWTSATEDAPKTPDTQKAAIKMKLGGHGEKGFIDTSILSDLADYAHGMLKEGMTRAKWVAHAIAEFGKDIRNLANRAWDRVVSAYRSSRLSSESGSVFSSAGGLLKRKMSELDQATAERGLRRQKSFEEATAAQKEIKRVVPDEKRQAAISVWREAGGDNTILAGWEMNAKGKAFQAAAAAAQTLTPEEKAIGQKAVSAFDILEKRGNKYDVLGSHRDNYIPHVWEVEKKGTGFGGARLQDKFKFNKARTFDTFFDGDQAGFIPKTMAIGNLLPAYMTEMNGVIADRQFIQDVHDKSATTGEPLVIPRGRVSEVESDSGGKATLVNPRAIKGKKDATGAAIDQSKYEVLQGQPALHDWLWEKKDSEGNPVFMRDDLSVHPELAKRLNAMMGQSAIRKWYNEPSTGLAVIPKAVAKNLDVAQSTMKREMFSFLAPFHQVQEATHGIGHLVNPFFNIPKIDLRSNAAQQDAVRHGLMLLPEKGSSQAYIEGLGGKNSFISQALRKFGKQPGEFIADIVDGYQDYLFHNYIPGLKYKTYEHILGRNTERFKNDLASGKITDADVKLISAEQANAAYGHLNYSLLDRNPTMQHIIQLGLLAPDFLEARGRFVGQSLKAIAGEKGGREQLRAIATLAAIQATAAYTISSLSGDKWDYKHPFEIIHNGRRFTLRSVPEDLFQLLLSGSDTRRQFVSARVNPLAQKVDQLRTGLNYRGEKTGALETIGETLTNYIPITARWIPGIRELTTTSRNNPVSPLEQLAGSMGLKISRYSPITKTHELANSWMDKQGISRQEGTYPVSKYQALRYALEDADMQRASGEYQKLLKGKAMTSAKIASGFKESIDHPFTGSQKNDREFADSLKGDDKLMYQHAMDVKQSILNKFYALPKAVTPKQIAKPAIPSRIQP